TFDQIKDLIQVYDMQEYNPKEDFLFKKDDYNLFIKESQSKYEKFFGISEEEKKKNNSEIININQIFSNKKHNHSSSTKGSSKNKTGHMNFIKGLSKNI
ncbi:MAG: hypothetical protein MJ252_24640, partial [archaeon]|nr:hypothetical protein [archaeon]